MGSGTVLLVAASLRSGSYTTRLLEHAGTLLPPELVAERVDLVRTLPYYDADLDGDNAVDSVLAARRTVADAAALIIATPEYNSTIPGGLKNTIDWITRPAREHVLVGKPVVVLGASPNSRGAIKAVTWLAENLGLLGATMVGEPVAVADVVSRFDENGRVDQEISERIRQATDALASLLRG